MRGVTELTFETLNRACNQIDCAIIDYGRFPLIKTGHPDRSICKTECTNLTYPCPSNFFKMARTIFGVIIFRDFAAPSLQNGAFDLQIGRQDHSILANGKHSTYDNISITELKAEAENLKLSLSSLATEREKSQAKERTAYFDDLYDLLQTTNVKMDRKILEHIAELLKLDIHPDNIIDMLRTVMAKNEDEEKVIYI